jgi:hypothetical protein
MSSGVGQHPACVAHQPGTGAADRADRSIIIFGMLLGQKFFSPFALTLILQQVQIVGSWRPPRAWSS